jgi:glycosyltransferase involved in cell wall biosynthesis
MDGLEWKRQKYSRAVQWFLKYAEKLAVKSSHFHIADSIVIRDYLNQKYNIRAHYIPYGATLIRNEKEKVLIQFNLIKFEYYLLMARMEPENNIDMILQGFSSATSKRKFIVIGNHSNSYGRSLVKKYKQDERIMFIGALFDQDLVHTLRKNSLLYFHGHSVGGTNPSLLEAMASKTVIAAHLNPFNKSILKNNAFYFSSSAEVRTLVTQSISKKNSDQIIANNLNSIKEEFNWEIIIDSYDQYINYCYQLARNEKNIIHRRFVFE